MLDILLNRNIYLDISEKNRKKTGPLCQYFGQLTHLPAISNLIDFFIGNGFVSQYGRAT